MKSAKPLLIGLGVALAIVKLTVFAAGTAVLVGAALSSVEKRPKDEEKDAEKDVEKKEK